MIIRSSRCTERSSFDFITSSTFFRVPLLLQHAAEEIVKFFPKEKVETYFQPYSSTGRTLARGKLYSRWINCKTKRKYIKVIRSPKCMNCLSSDSQDSLTTSPITFIKQEKW